MRARRSAHANRSLHEIEERIDALEIRFAGRERNGAGAWRASSPSTRRWQRLAASYAMELTRLLALARKDVEAARRAQKRRSAPWSRRARHLRGSSGVAKKRSRISAANPTERVEEGDDAWLHRPHREEIA
jgi:hypothetical protein